MDGPLHQENSQNSWNQFLQPCARKDMSTAYLDDSVLLGSTERECIENSARYTEAASEARVCSTSNQVSLKTIKENPILRSRGRHWINDSYSHSRHGICKLKDSCLALIKKEKPVMREVAQVIGQIVASSSAIKYRLLYYCHLEHDKKRGFKEKPGWLWSHHKLVSRQ